LLEHAGRENVAERRIPRAGGGAGGRAGAGGAFSRRRDPCQGARRTWAGRV